MPEGGSLADLIAMMNEGPICPEPRKCPPAPSYSIKVMLGDFRTGRPWDHEDELYIDAEPGTLNRAGGGHCWITTARVEHPIDGVSLPGHYAPPDCVALPEPAGLWLGLLGAVLLGRKRKKAPLA